MAGRLGPFVLATSLAFVGLPARVAEAAPEPVIATPEPPPPPGKAMMGLGIFGIVFGALNISGGIAILAIDPGDAGFTGWYPLAFGAAFTTLGALGTHYGNQRRLEHRAWEQRTGMDLERWRGLHPGQGRPPGRGLVVGGSLLACGGLALFVSGVAVQATYGDSASWPIFNIVAGSVILAGSGTMMGIGGRRLHRHRQQARALTWTMPTPTFGPHGFGLSIAGRF
jgi:hypothetical protein